ncbi:MAG TPA: hypothetical protein VG733_19130, partial [Chthoniobacteraceae bacterium]|nr:hypothetical protein [Chthoniobacteraceae bacterium]
VLLPTGQTLLMPHDKDPLKAAFQTEDGAWKATQEGDVFTLKGAVDQDDWTLRFEKGRVRELKVTDAAPIEWVYKGDYVSQIRLKEGKKTVAFSVSFGADGHPDAFTVSGWQHRFKLSHVALMDDGKAANGGEAASVTANDPGVTLTEWISGEEEDALQHDVFDYGKDEDGHPTLNYNYLDPNEGDLKVALSWDGATGQILTEDDWRYTVKPSQQPGDPPAITRVNDKGEYEYIAVDRARATVMTHLLGKEDTIARFDSDVAWKISTAGEDGVYHTVKRVDFDQYGILRRLGRDEEGALDLEYFNDEHLFHEGPDNDDEKPKPPPVIPADVFKATEALLLANVEGAKGNFQRNNSLEDLARFYIRTGNFKTAFDLASQISDRSLQFEIRELSCAADPKMSAEEKGAWLKVLRKDFPQEDLIGKMLEEYNVQ